MQGLIAEYAKVCNVDAEDMRHNIANDPQGRAQFEAWAKTQPVKSPTVYRNSNFTKRDYEATNIVACVTNGPAPQPYYVAADESTLTGLTQLWREGSVTYYGYL